MKIDIVDEILENGHCYCIDFVPEKIDSPIKYDWIECFLFMKKNKKYDSDKLIRFLIKCIAYYDAYLIMTESSLKNKKYNKDILITDTNPKEFNKYLKKSFLTGKTITILIEDSAVLELELYNTGIYLLNHDDIYFFEEIARSEGLFVRKVEE